jgi:hypothetical protein
MKKYNLKEFANEIRTKHPSSYDDLTDEKLVELWLKKFPEDLIKVQTTNSKTFNTILNKNVLLGGLLVVLLVILSLYLTRTKTSESKIVNFLAYDSDTIWLKNAYFEDDYFEDIYFSDSKLTQANAYDNAKFYIELCHRESKNEVLSNNSGFKPKELPVGKYEFRKEVGNSNWKPYSILSSGNLLCIVNCPDVFNCPEADKYDIVSGSKLNVTKTDENIYILEWQLNLANGKSVTGNYHGAINMMTE